MAMLISLLSVATFVERLLVLSEHFSQLGISQGYVKSSVYAAEYPERAKKLILLGGYGNASDRALFQLSDRQASG
jgi:pimeloyl-ACP methyl ester carboxylesterase